AESSARRTGPHEKLATIGTPRTTGSLRPPHTAGADRRSRPGPGRAARPPRLLVPLSPPAENTRMLDFAALKRDALARALRRHLAGEVRFDATSRRLYSTDASIYQVMPLGVVIPRTPDDLVSAVQIAAELEVPIVPRGGGTSLSGQSIGPGLIIDCSKYLNAVLDIDPAGRVARVQPGVVLDQFNRALAPHGLQFGPEVATATRANLGGMIGNNSAGSRSIVYGKTGDHVRRLRVVLSDGTTAEFGPVGPAEWDRRADARGREAEIYRDVRRVAAANAEEIRRRFPKL